MHDYSFLLALALILIATKVFGLATEHCHLPQVVGALLAGIILGPTGFGILESSDFLTKTAQIGVIMLMFTAGIDTDLKELKETGPLALGIAVVGVIAPILICGGIYYAFFLESFTYENVLKASFVGVVFAATSVSITVETLNEMGKLKTKLGATLLSAALIDDILGIIVLSLISGLAGSTDSPMMVLGRIGMFFVFTLVIGIVMQKFFKVVSKEHWHSRRVAVWALAFCFLMAYCAEALFGVADITGAFFAGLILCNVSRSRQFVAKKITVGSYLIFAPVFFASVGMKTDLRTMSGSMMIFAVVLLLGAIFSKIIGCGFVARCGGSTSHESLVMGVGMMARGEVALMVAQKGINAGMIDANIFPPIVFAIIMCALTTPAILKAVISRGPEIK